MTETETETRKERLRRDWEGVWGRLDQRRKDLEMSMRDVSLKVEQKHDWFVRGTRNHIKIDILTMTRLCGLLKLSVSEITEIETSSPVDDLIFRLSGDDEAARQLLAILNILKQSKRQ